MTRAFATYNVTGQPGPDERDILALADDYRRELCEINQQRHERTIDLRNRLFPDLYAAMVRWELAKARIYDVEREIKAHHSDAQNRNAVPPDLRERLESLRAERAAAAKEIAEHKRPWLAMLKDFRAHYKAEGERLFPGRGGDGQSGWVLCKALPQRRAAYSQMQWPEHIADYAAMWLELDLRLRELSERYQACGLHSSIRAEIVEASQPKLSKDKPGIRYRYGRKPDPKPWGKITLQIPGGVTIRQAIAGRCRSLVMEPDPLDKDERIYRVTQQIGTTGHPREIQYTVLFHRLPDIDWKIQRWSLVCRQCGPRVRRYAIPVFAGLEAEKPKGQGLLTYDITWTRRRNGVRVCTFRGEHVNEELLLPHWLLEKRLAMRTAQAQCDALANSILERRGISSSKQPGELQGVAAMEKYCADNPADASAGNQLDRLHKTLAYAAKQQRKAIACIEKIYETVARRVCSLHSELVPDSIDLSQMKRYDARDLLKEDRIPLDSRTILQAVAPGKLVALLKGYGLASGKVTPEEADALRGHETTDVFTSWVNSLGGGEPKEKRRKPDHSQSGAKSGTV